MSNLAATKRKASGGDPTGPSRAEIDSLIEQILADADGTGEQLWAFRQAFADEVPATSLATVVGQPVSVLKFDFNGNELRGVTATCISHDGSRHTISVTDIVFPPRTKGALHVAAYRKWMGLPAIPPKAGRTTTVKSAAADEDRRTAPGALVDLAVLSVGRLAVRCRRLTSEEMVTLRGKRYWDLAPGEIVTLLVSKRWKYSGEPCVAGGVLNTRVSTGELGLTPLELHPKGDWNPAEEYWGEPTASWCKPIIARGRRPQFEMEQVLPGADPDDPFDDPILKSTDLRDAGDTDGAQELLQALCEADLRCLDAHAHLGNLEFDRAPERALRHYEIGVRIGELSLEPGFEGVLAWGMIDNRPFLRCLHGHGLCQWRLGQRKEARNTFERLLWLNPTDNQGARYLLHDLRAGRIWSPDL